MSILKKFKILCLTTLALISIQTRGENDDRKKIIISGSSTFDRIILDKEHEIESKTGFNIRAKANGSLYGIKDLASGKADLAMTSASLDILSSKLKEIDISKLKEFEIK